MSANTIYVNAMFRSLQSMAKSVVSSAGSPSFASYMQRAKLGESEDSAAYRASVEERIALMPIHPTRVRDDVFIDISDAGYEAMREDPEYEAWVLGTIESALGSADPFASIAGSNAVHFQFGASPEEFRANAGREGSGSIGELTGTGKDKGYWEERQERLEENRELNEKIQDARARARSANELKRIRGEETTGADDASAASEIIALLLASYMQGMQ